MPSQQNEYTGTGLTRERRLDYFSSITLTAAIVAALGAGIYAVFYLLNPARPWQVGVAFLLLFSNAPVFLLMRWIALRGALEPAAILLAAYTSLSIGGITLFLPETLPLAAVAFVVLILLVGLVLQPRTVFWVALGGGVLYLVFSWAISQQWVEPLHINPRAMFYLSAAFYTLIFLLVARLSWLATQDLQRALQETQQRAMELQAAAEEQRRMLAELEARSAEQARLLDLIRELSAPVIPALEGVVIIPLVGHIDPERARQIQAALLAGVEQYRAQVAILDVTGVPVVDSRVMGLLREAVLAARLMGCQVVLTGIRPEMAEALVEMEVLPEVVITLRSLQRGIEYAEQVAQRTEE